MSTESPKHPDHAELFFAGVVFIAKLAWSKLYNWLRTGIWWISYPIALLLGQLRLVAETAGCAAGIWIIALAVWHFFGKQSGFASSWEDYLALGFFIVSIVFAVYVIQQARDRKELLALLHEGALLSAGRQMTQEQITYGFLVKELKHSSDVDFAKSALKTLTDAAGKCCSEMATSEISRDYRRNDCRATDYLCVIHGTHDTAYLKMTNFAGQLNYYAGFDRHERPYARITRVFSVPVFLNNGKPQWNKKPSFFNPLLPKPLIQEQRDQLFLLLWVNRAFGVDTKLHFYDPTKTAKDDVKFFEMADYVLCQDPTNANHAERERVYFAIPGDELHCMKIAGHPLLTRLFHYEFYCRLTAGHDPHHPSDMMLDMIRQNCGKRAKDAAHCIHDLLGCSDMTKTLRPLLADGMKRASETPNATWQKDPDTERMEERWKEWEELWQEKRA